MRKLLMPALLAIMATVACHGAAAADSGEEVQAAKLIHGLANGVLVFNGKGIITQLSSSPATFKFGDVANDPSQAKFTGVISVTRVGKCTYQSEFDFSRFRGLIGKFIIDLSGLATEGFPNNQPEGQRVLNGAAVTCNSLKRANSDEDLCSKASQPETVTAFADISGADFSAMATKFKQDFCQ